LQPERVITLAGWKYPLEITPAGGAIVWRGFEDKHEELIKAEPLERNDPLIRQVQKVLDLKSFTRFCKRYGLLMIDREVKAVLLKEQTRLAHWNDYSDLCKAGFTLQVEEVPADVLEHIWEACEPRFKNLQKRLEHLGTMNAQAKRQHLAKVLTPKLKAEPFGKGRGFPKNIYLHAETLEAACYLLILLNLEKGYDLKPCENCGKLFPSRSNKRYCDPNCKPSMPTDVRRAKARIKAKLAYYEKSLEDNEHSKLENNSERAEAVDNFYRFETKVLAALKKAKTIDEVEKVASKFDLDIDRRTKAAQERAGMKAGGMK